MHKQLLAAASNLSSQLSRWRDDERARICCVWRRLMAPRPAAALGLAALEASGIELLGSTGFLDSNALPA